MHVLSFCRLPNDAHRAQRGVRRLRQARSRRARLQGVHGRTQARPPGGPTRGDVTAERVAGDPRRDRAAGGVVSVSQSVQGEEDGGGQVQGACQSSGRLFSSLDLRQ